MILQYTKNLPLNFFYKTMTQVTSRSYGYFYKIRIFIKFRSSFSKLCQNQHFFWQKHQGTLGVNNLDFGPIEWKWKKLGGLKKTSFFSYQIKRGYRHTCSNSFTTSPYDKEPQRSSYFPFQKRIIHIQVWHIWRCLHFYVYF